MPLYKYFPPARVDVIQSLSIRYTQPAAFNDPFEARPNFTGLMPQASMISSYPIRFKRILFDQYLSMTVPFKEEILFEEFLISMDFMRVEIYSILKYVDDSFVPQINSIMHETFG
jgi:hypothetical protein